MFADINDSFITERWDFLSGLKFVLTQLRFKFVLKDAKYYLDLIEWVDIFMNCIIDMYLETHVPYLGLNLEYSSKSIDSIVNRFFEPMLDFKNIDGSYRL